MHRSMRLALVLSGSALSQAAFAAPIRVAISHNPSSAATASQLKAQLDDDTWFDFTTTIVPASGLDSATELAAYDVVILGDSGNNAVDWTPEMATALKAFAQAGGGVVSVGWVDYVTAGPVEAIDDVQPIDAFPAHYNFCSGGSTMNIVGPSHPVTAGLTAITTSSNNQEYSAVAPDGTNAVILGRPSCNSGGASLVVGEYGSGRTVYLGHMYLANTGYNNGDLRSGDADRLLEQALAWAAVPDSDGDGVRDNADMCPGFDDNVDADADGLADGCDTCPNDALNDADADDVCGNVDICEGHDDNVDADADGLPDGCDTCPNDALNDADEDGVCGDIDVCPGFDDLLDTDSDGLADGCDTCPTDALNDADDDGVCGDVDACEGHNDAVDTDGDGVADGCDTCPNSAADDADEDGVCDDLDLCVGDDATGDTDADGVCDDVDVCEGDDATGDTDADGVCDDVDVCEGHDDALDTDADGIPNGCDVCAEDALNDADADGVCDAADICLGFDDNADADVDTLPDGCDTCPNDAENDADEDGVCGDVDLCEGDDALGDDDGDGVCGTPAEEETGDPDEDGGRCGCQSGGGAGGGAWVFGLLAAFGLRRRAGGR